MNYFVLNNIRSSWNVGAIMRTCDALKMSIILVGYTPKPIGKTLSMIRKTAIGAENTVNWEHFENYQLVLNTHQKESNNHYGIELDTNSIDMFEYLSKPKNINTKDTNNKNTFLWLGNEISGLETDLMSNLDVILHLKMLGSKESLNVSNCACAAGYLLEYLSNS